MFLKRVSWIAVYHDFFDPGPVKVLSAGTDRIGRFRRA